MTTTEHLTPVRVPAAAAPDDRRRVGDAVGAARPAFVLGAAAAVGLPAANGGYFPTSWGWSGLALVAVAALTLLVTPAGH